MPLQERQEESAAERLFVIGGSGVAIAGMLERSTLKSLGMMLVGGVLVMKGLAERANLRNRYRAGNMSKTEQAPVHKGIKLKEMIVIEKSAHEVYLLWRNFENLPKLMGHVKSVRETGDGQSLWSVEAPFDNQVSWEAQMTEDVPGERISWRSLPGAIVQNAGMVEFESISPNESRVTLTLEYNPPLGSLGVKFAQLMGEDPEKQLQEDLHSFKLRAERGELPSAVG